MRIKIKLLNRNSLTAFFALTIFSLGNLLAVDAKASNNKIDVEIGAYSLKAKSGTASGNISSLGIYRVGYRRVITPHFDIGIGYTVLFTKIVTGDTGFGLDLNGTYYFLGASNLVEAQGEHSYLSYSEDLRPYVSLNFSQRNYQSIQTSYAGFGAALGVEKSLTDRLGAKISVRYNSLSAGGSASATELSFLGGIVIEF